MKSFKKLICSSFLLSLNAFGYTCSGETESFKYDFQHNIGENFAYLNEYSEKFGIPSRTYKLQCNTSPARVLCDVFEEFTLDKINGFTLKKLGEKVYNKSDIVVKGEPNNLKIFVRSRFDAQIRNKRSLSGYTLTSLHEASHFTCD